MAATEVYDSPYTELFVIEGTLEGGLLSTSKNLRRLLLIFIRL